MHGSLQADEEDDRLLSVPSEQRTCTQKLRDLWSKRKKLIIIASIAFLVLLILIIVLAVVLGGKSSSSNPSQPITPTPTPDPHPPTPTPDPDEPVNPDNPDNPPEPKPEPVEPIASLLTNANPYQLVGSPDTSQVGKQTYLLQREAGLETQVYDFLQSPNNSYIDQLTVEVYQIAYDTIRLQFFNSNSSQPSFQVPDSFLNSEYLNNYKRGITFNNTAFEVLQDSDNYYYLNIRSPYTDEVLLSTYNQSFISMNHYQQFGFRVNASALYGLGERKENFYISKGNHTIFSLGTNSAGMHPFIMCQLTSGDFLGVFFLNANGQQYEVSYWTQEIDYPDGTMVNVSYADVLFTSTGGIIDFFTFTGPSFQDVIRQYHHIIGQPSLLPKWNNGFTSASIQYYSNDQVNTALDALISTGIPVDMIGADERQLLNNLDLSYNLNLSQIESTYDVRILQAYTALVPANTSTTEEALVDILNANLTVQAGGFPIFVQELATDNVGFSFDYFNPNIQPALQKIFQNEKNICQRGIWLQDNAPFFETYKIRDDANLTNPFYSIPFWPGENGNPYHFNDKDSLPFFAEHLIGYNGDLPITEYHYNLHGLFGTQMAKQVIQSTGCQPYILAEQTFAGAGSQGIAHILLQQDLNMTTVNDSVAGVLGFNMFGIPNVSPNICGFSTFQSVHTPTSCLKSYQLAFISPVAISYSDHDPLTKQLLLGNQAMGLQVANLLYQRLQYLIYTRSELYKISKMGGTLARPRFADYSDFEHHHSYSSVLYGSALLVEFNFQPESHHKTITLPPDDWLNLNDTTQIKNSSLTQQSHTYTVYDDSLLLFQKAGTIIATQNVIAHNVTRVKDLINVPIQITGVINNNNNNIGHVIFDNETTNIAEFYEIKANNNFMTFKLQTNASVIQDVPMKQIEKITLAFTDSPGVNKACAIMNDYNTIQELYVGQNFTQGMANNITVFTPNDPSNATDMTKLYIDQVAFIVYGYNTDQNFTCYNIMQSYVTDFDFAPNVIGIYYANLSPNLKNLVPTIKDYILFVDVTDDDMLIFKVQQNFTVDDEVDFYNETVYNSTNSTIEVNDTVTINIDPFYLQVHKPGDPTDVYLSTLGQLLIVTQDLTLFGFNQPKQDPHRTFGLGERKGKFFLQDNHLYSLFTNDNNVQDLYQHDSRVNVFGKNGYYPLIISQENNHQRYSGINLFSNPYDILYQTFNRSTQALTAITQLITPMNNVQFSYMFSRELPIIYQKLPKNFITQEIIMPPVYAYGQYASTKNLKTFDDFQTLISNYSTNKYPLDGFFLDYKMLDAYQSLTYNTTIFTPANIYNLTQQHMAVVVKLLSGVKINSPEGQQFIQNSSYFNSSFNHFIEIGQDQTGNVLYPDFATNYGFHYLLNYTLQQMSDFQGKSPNFDKFSIDLVQNELTNVYCNGNCYHRDHFQIQPQKLYKVGTNAQLAHTFSFSNNYDDHDLYGTIQSLTYAESGQLSAPRMFFSASTSYVSGFLPNIAHVATYFTEADSFNTILQSLLTTSCSGMPNIGFEWAMKDANSFNVSLLNNLMPVSVSNVEYFVDSPLVNYKYFMMHYVKTEVYQQVLNGYPMIRPIFFEFPTIDSYYNEYYTSFLLGPSFLINIPLNDSTPYGYWCEIMYFVESPRCFDSTQVNEKRVILLKTGTITPLQDIYQGLYPISEQVITNTYELALMAIDLHMFLSHQMGLTGGIATGYLLIESGTVQPPCLIEMLGADVIVEFKTIKGDMTQCTSYQGYRAGKLIIYDEASFVYVSAIVNGVKEIQLETDALRNYKYFDLSQAVNQIQEIVKIEFR